jgi:hypothetical protein
MKSPILSRASFRSTLSKFSSVWMIAALLAGAAFAAQPFSNVLAATACATSTDGNWTTTVTWSCGSTPNDNTYDVTIANDVNLAANTVINDLTVGPTGLLSLTGNLTVHNLDIQPGGILSLADIKTLTVNGNFTVEANGLFDPGIGLGAQSDQGGAVVLGPGDQTLTLNGATVDFWDLTKQTSGSPSAFETLTVDSGQIHVLHHLTLTGVNNFNLHLAGLNPPTQWELNATGTDTIDYVDVRDSNNVSGVEIWVNNWHDSGNNSGWSGVPTTNITSSANPVVSGSPVTFTVDVPLAKFGGTVAFKDTTTSKGTVTIPGCNVQSIDEETGTSSCTTSSLTVDSHTILAVYSVGPSNSGSLVQVVQPFTMVSVTSSGSPSLSTDNVTFTAKVMPMTALANVAFNDNGVAIGSCSNQTVDQMTGFATCTVKLAVGSHAITVDNGKTQVDPTLVTSAPLIQKVMTATSLTLTGPGSSPKIHISQTVTFTATANPADATGLVTFQSSGSDIPGCVGIALSSGQASCQVSTLAVKNHTITAIYAGDATHMGATSNSTSLLIELWKYFAAIIRNK